MVTNSAEALAIIRLLRPNQRDVLGMISMNQDAGHYPATVAKLKRLGLIEASEQRLPGRWPVTVQRYSVPVFVHIAYCEWCASHSTEEDY